MPSCPRCGAPVQASDLICPRCHTSLTTAQPAGGAVSRSMQGAPTPGTSANGPRPASTDADARTSSLTHESWGPGTWGPHRDALNEAPPPEHNAASAMPPPPTPASNMPTPSASAFREYGARPAFPPHRGYSAPPGPTGAPTRPVMPAPGGSWAPIGANYPPNTSGYPLIPQNGRVPLAPGYPVVPTTPGAPVLPGYAALGLYPGYAVYPYGLPPRKPPNPPGETYRKVVSILAVIASSLALLAGFGLLAVLLLLTINAEGQDTSVVNLLIIGGIAGVVGGGLSLYHATRSLMRRASAPFSLPNFWLLLGATLVVFVAGIGLFASGQPTGPLALADPLILLSGIAPALTILALAAQRLQGTVTWRHLWLSLTCGATLGIGVALIAELLLALWLSSIFGLLNLDPTMLNPDQNNPSEFIALLLLLAVVAPLVEESSKQLGGFFLLPRIKSASEAFLLGLAAGIGFNIVETSQYIGAGQADWIGVAIGRVGAGLIHGMGAAMAGLGWYYLLRGKGIRRRWTLGFGCLLYAYVQHALLNGGELLVAIHFPTWHLDLLGIILDAGVAYAFLLYLLIIGVLLFVTGWLRRTAPRSPGANALDSLRDAPSPPARVTLASQSVRPPAGAGAASGAGGREDIRLSGELPPVANEVGQRNEPGGAA